MPELDTAETSHEVSQLGTQGLLFVGVLALLSILFSAILRGWWIIKGGHSEIYEAHETYPHAV